MGLRPRAVAAHVRWIDDDDMSIIDRSPGGFVIIANIVLYSTVLAEVGMLVSGSLAVMGAVMVLIATISAGLCAFIMRIMGSEAYILGEVEDPAATVVAKASAPAPAATPRATRPRHTPRVSWHRASA